jgi:ferredoxin
MGTLQSSKGLTGLVARNASSMRASKRRYLNTTSMPSVRWSDSDPKSPSLQITVLEATNTDKLEIPSLCGGLCACGTSAVKILAGGEGLSTPEPLELSVLGPVRAKQTYRLSCQDTIQGPVQVELP